MKALLYGIALQWKLDIRSKTLLITCYMVPLLFFRYHGRILLLSCRNQKDTFCSRYDSDGGIHGRINWFTAVFGRNIWQWYEKKFIKQTGYLSILDCSQPLSLQ